MIAGRVTHHPCHRRDPEPPDPSGGMPGPPDPPAERLAYCVDEATRLTGPSRDLLNDQIRRGHGPGNARLAVRLLDQATARQARRITTAPQPQDPATLSTIDAADIPGHIDPGDPPADDQWPGQYL